LKAIQDFPSKLVWVFPEHSSDAMSALGH